MSGTDDNPYASRPIRRDLLADVRTIAHRADWNDDTPVQLLVLFVAKTGEHGPDLMSFLEVQEADEKNNLIE